jgi:hypothetical protein
MTARDIGALHSAMHEGYHKLMGRCEELQRSLQVRNWNTPSFSLVTPA